jgi:DNA-binding CsgD family transcriptional regulator
MKNRSVDRHLEFCTTDYQRQVIKLHISGLSQSAIAKQLSRHPKRVHALISTVHTKAALAGFAPSFNLDRETAPGFATKGSQPLITLITRSYCNGTFRSPSSSD